MCRGFWAPKNDAGEQQRNGRHTMAECGICIEKFNKTKRKHVVCPYCPTEGAVPTCITCVKTYLLQDDAAMPRCAVCRSGWTEDFMTQTFAKTWLLKEYKAHREQVLLDTERARLPEAQEDAARYRRAFLVVQGVDAQTAPIYEQIRNLPQTQAEKDAYTLYLTANGRRTVDDRQRRLEMTELLKRETELAMMLDNPTPLGAEDPVWRREMEALPETDPKSATYKEYRTIRDTIRDKEAQNAINRTIMKAVETDAWRRYTDARYALGAAKHPYNQRIKALHTREYKAAKAIVNAVGRNTDAAAAAAAATTAAATPERSRWTFVMKCTRPTCEGFVGTNWKCGLCEVQFCKECGEECGNEDTNHTCDPDVRSTHQALRKEAKPCPKCAAMISKIDGCDQMWCTQCQTAFSWRTGQIETAHIHNPHYFQWMRQTGSAAPLPPIALGDCLNLQPEELLDQVLHYSMRRRQHLVTEWARSIRHYRWVHRNHQHTLQEKQNDDWRRQLRVKRLVNEITDDVWKDRLQRGEKAAQKEYAVIQVLDLFLQASMDILRNTLPDDADVPTLFEQQEALRKFCNEEMAKIQKRYNNDTVYLERPRLHRGAIMED